MGTNGLKINWNFYKWWDSRRLNASSDSLNHVLKNLEISQNSNTNLLKENKEYLKKELNSKDDLIKLLMTHRLQY